MTTDADQLGEVARLGEEQAALRRVAILVAEGPTEEEFFDFVAREVAALLGLSMVTIDRYDADEHATVVLASIDDPGFPVGSRWPLDGPSLAASVIETGRPARIDDYSDLASSSAAAARTWSIRSTVGVPVIVDGAVWGVICVGTDLDPLPEDTEQRLAGFTELLAASVSTNEAREGRRKLLEEQAALRRLATLVAEGASPSHVFSAVAEEVAELFSLSALTISRYEGGTTLVVADPHDSRFPVGSRWPLDGDSLSARVLATGATARIDDYSGVPGAIAEAMRASPSAAAVGVPIMVDGRIWGILTVGSPTAASLPLDTEARLAAFTELVATAISNSEAREGLRALADQQASLRRVATRVAEGASAADVAAVVAEEVGHVLDVPGVSLDRYDPDGATTVIAAWGEIPFPAGTRWPVEPGTVAHTVLETRGPARLNHYAGVDGDVAGALREHYPDACIVGAPIIVDGTVWGMIGVGVPAPGVLPPDTESRLVEFTELVATAISNTASRDRLRTLADEQASLRRVATLVAQGTSTEDLVAAVCEEVAHVVGMPSVTLDRFDPDGAFTTVIGSWQAEGQLIWPVGDRWPLDGPSVAKQIWDTGRPAQILEYRGLSGSIAGHYGAQPAARAIGVPIIVDNRIWGMIAVGSSRPDEVPADTEARLASFTELVATAIANSQARDGLRKLVDEQTALRRVATLVAEGASAIELFAAVTEEVGTVLGVPSVILDRYEADGSTTVIATWGLAPLEAGTRWPAGPGTAAGQVLETGRPARVNDYRLVEGPIGEAITQEHPRASVVGVPIVVDGRVWGMMGVGMPGPDTLPPDTEQRLGHFTELLATAIANRAARDSLRTLADEQAALRRVATLVAQGATAVELCSAVAKEVWHLLEVPAVTLDRYDQDGFSTVLGSWGEFPFKVGSRWPIDPGTASGIVFETARPVRLSGLDYAAVTGPIATALRELPAVSIVAVPIEVDNVVWGIMGVASTEVEPLPEGLEARLSGFTELVATAISNAEARDRVRGLAEEQAALHRVAALVAEGTEPATLFDAVCEEAGRLLGAASVNLSHYTQDGFNVTMAGWSLRDTHVPAGARFPMAPDTVGGAITQTGAPARVDSWEGKNSEMASAVRSRGIRSSVGAPVVVEGALWGALVAATDSDEPLAPGTEFRLARFTELIATAISNAATRAELIASRARIVAAGDEARRRIERNLHDGTQQQLIALGLELQAVRATVPDQLSDTTAGLERMEHEIEAVLEDVRELSRGLHPALLARAGLAPSLRALGRRSPIPVSFDVQTGERPPEPVETCIYFVVSEALTNAIKYSRATEISVAVSWTDTRLHATIEDDGVGGADAEDGSGLTGLLDRVEALGGRFSLRSRADQGTKIAVELPFATTG